MTPRERFARLDAAWDGARHHVWAHASRSPGIVTIWALAMLLCIAASLLAWATPDPMIITRKWIP